MTLQNARAEQLLTVLSNVKTSPKWSFRGRSDNARLNGNPGPGSYQPGIDGRHRSTSAWGFGNAVRDGGKASGDPGPGAYNPAAHNGDPKWSMTPRRGDSLNLRSTTPGPGTYKLNDGGSAPRYGFGSSTRAPLRASNTPGPGTYNYTENDFDRSSPPKWGMGTSNRPPLNPYSATPGPGQYNLQDGTPGPKYSLTARRDRSLASETPGPGTYAANNGIGSESPSYSLRQRTNIINAGNFAPGPGAYNPNVGPARTASPNWRFGTSNRPALQRQEGAAPGSYNPYDPNNVSPSWGMGSSLRPPLNRANATPGPGQYNLQDGTPGPKFSMTPKRSKYMASDSPGPGAYRADLYNPQELPKWGFGSATQRPPAHNAEVPGPGHYPIGSGLSGPQFTMRGKSQQRGGAGNTNLGPTVSQFGY